MKAFKRKLAILLVFVFMFAQMPVQVFADIYSHDAPVAVSGNDLEITVNFPGVDGVRVNYNSNISGWQTVTLDADGSYTFNLPVAHFPTAGVLTVQAYRNGMSFSFPVSISDVNDYADNGIPLELDVPLREITVSGINGPATVSVVQGGWVYQNVPVSGNNTANPFIVFDNGSAYEVRLHAAGYHALAGRMTGTTGDEDLWFGSLFSQHLVPEGVTNIGISNANWVDTTITHSFGMGGDVITLFNNNTQAWLTFDYGGRTFVRIPFMLDGRNPFADITIVKFDGMTGVTLYIDGTAVAEGPFDHFTILNGVPQGAVIMGSVTVGGPASRTVSLPVTVVGLSVELPVVEVEVVGVEIPGIGVEVRRANNNTHANGPLQHNSAPNTRTGGGFTFHTFESAAGEDQWFVANLTGGGFGGFHVWWQGYFVDLSSNFTTSVVPEGVTGATLRNAANNAIIFNNLNEGDTFTIINTGRDANLVFTYGGVEYTVVVTLDGCPFERIVILRFPGILGVNQVSTWMLGRGTTTMDNLSADNHFLFLNDKWVGSNNAQLLDIRLQTTFLGQQTAVPYTTQGYARFTVIDIPVTTITVVNNLGWNVHATTRSMNSPNANPAGTTGIWFPTDYETEFPELVFVVFDQDQYHFLQANAPGYNDPAIVVRRDVRPGDRVYLSDFFGVPGQPGTSVTEGDILFREQRAPSEWFYIIGADARSDDGVTHGHFGNPALQNVAFEAATETEPATFTINASHMTTQIAIDFSGLIGDTPATDVTLNALDPVASNITTHIYVGGWDGNDRSAYVVVGRAAGVAFEPGDERSLTFELDVDGTIFVFTVVIIIDDAPPVVPMHNLTVAVAPATGGTATGARAGGTPGTTVTAPHWETIYLVAEELPGYTFIRWDAVGIGYPAFPAPNRLLAETTLNMPAWSGAVVTAVFAPIAQTEFILTVNYDNAMGTATFTPDNPITVGDEVTLEAVAEEGYEFVRWVWSPAVAGNPGIADATDPDATFYMPARDVTLVAQFRPIYVPNDNITFIVINHVTGAPSTAASPKASPNPAAAGEEVTLHANIEYGYEFVIWGWQYGEVSGASFYPSRETEGAVFTMPTPANDVVLVLRIRPIPPPSGTITFIVINHITGAVSTAAAPTATPNPATAGEEVTLNANIDYGYEFVIWGWQHGGVSGTSFYPNRETEEAVLTMPTPANDVVLVLRIQPLPPPPPPTGLQIVGPSSFTIVRPVMWNADRTLTVELLPQGYVLPPDWSIVWESDNTAALTVVGNILTAEWSIPSGATNADITVTATLLNADGIVVDYVEFTIYSRVRTLVLGPQQGRLYAGFAGGATFSMDTQYFDPGEYSIVGVWTTPNPIGWMAGITLGNPINRVNISASGADVLPFNTTTGVTAIYDNGVLIPRVVTGRINVILPTGMSVNFNSPFAAVIEPAPTALRPVPNPIPPANNTTPIDITLCVGGYEDLEVEAVGSGMRPTPVFPTQMVHNVVMDLPDLWYVAWVSTDPSVVSVDSPGSDMTAAIVGNTAGTATVTAQIMRLDYVGGTSVAVRNIVSFEVEVHDCAPCTVCAAPCNANCDPCTVCEAPCNANCDPCVVCGAECNDDCDPCAVCGAECNDDCAPCAVCESACNANCVPCVVCESACNANCVPCVVCESACNANCVPCTVCESACNASCVPCVVCEAACNANCVPCVVCESACDANCVPCVVCESACNANCVPCVVCESVCNANCVPCAVCEAPCNDSCVPCAVCEAPCNDNCVPCANCGAPCDYNCVPCEHCHAYPCACIPALRVIDFMPTDTEGYYQFTIELSGILGLEFPLNEYSIRISILGEEPYYIYPADIFTLFTFTSLDSFIQVELLHPNIAGAVLEYWWIRPAA